MRLPLSFAQCQVLGQVERAAPDPVRIEGRSIRVARKLVEIGFLEEVAISNEGRVRGRAFRLRVAS